MNCSFQRKIPKSLNQFKLIYLIGIKKEHRIDTFHIMKFCMSFVQLAEVHWINNFLVRATYDLLLPLDNMYRSKFVETIMYCRRDGHISLDRFRFIFPGTYSMILCEK